MSISPPGAGVVAEQRRRPPVAATGSFLVAAHGRVGVVRRPAGRRQGLPARRRSHQPRRRQGPLYRRPRRGLERTKQKNKAQKPAPCSPRRFVATPGRDQGGPGEAARRAGRRLRQCDVDGVAGVAAEPTARRVPAVAFGAHGRRRLQQRRLVLRGVGAAGAAAVFQRRPAEVRDPFFSSQDPPQTEVHWIAKDSTLIGW